MMTDEEMRFYDFLVDEGIANASEINLVYNIAISYYGNWTNILQAIMHTRTGYRSIEQYIEGEYDPESEEE